MSPSRYYFGAEGCGPRRLGFPAGGTQGLEPGIGGFGACAPSFCFCLPGDLEQVPYQARRRPLCPRLYQQGVTFQVKVTESHDLFYVGIFPTLFWQTIIIHLENVPIGSLFHFQSLPRTLSCVTLSGFSEGQCRKNRGSRGQGEGPMGHAGAAQVGCPGPGVHEVLGLPVQLIPPELALAARPGEGSRGKA